MSGMVGEVLESMKTADLIICYLRRDVYSSSKLLHSQVQGLRGKGGGGGGGGGGGVFVGHYGIIKPSPMLLTICHVVLQQWNGRWKTLVKCFGNLSQILIN